MMRIVVYDGPSAPGDKPANLHRLERLAAAARRAGGDLLVLPQLFLTGSCNDRAAAMRLAEVSDGPAALAVAATARRERIAILCGYIELCTGQPWDAALLVDEQGCALLNYRRTHLLTKADSAIFGKGQWLSTAPLQGRKVALLTGADIEVPEPARALALAGAAILLLPALHPPTAALVTEALLPTRAYENGLVIAYANGHGDPDAPRSRIVGADGRVLAQAAAAGDLALADIPDSATGSSRLRGRRPRLYQRLALMAEEG